MFDANMRMLPKGHRSFAKVESVKAGGLWEQLGLQEGQLLLCTTLKSGCWNNSEEDLLASARIHLPSGKSVDILAWGEDTFYSRMVYQGTVTVERKCVDFIDDKIKQEVVKLLEEVYNEEI